MKNLITANVQSVVSMFEGCESIQHIDIFPFRFPMVNDFSFMFKGCKKLSFVNFEGIDTDYADSMTSMFEGSGFTSLDLSNFNTMFVSDFTSMFKDMTSLQTLNIPWSTDSAINMTSMFENCGSLYSLNISTFETPKIEKYDNIFKGINDIQPFS